jgi:hypothetical protein
VAFATKPALAALMITAAVDGELPAPWATVDEVYGADPELRRTPQQRGIGDILGIGSSRTVTTVAGTERVDVLATSRGGPGSAVRRAPAPRASAGIPGRSSRPATATAGIICWCAATTRPASWPITDAIAPHRRPWPTMCGCRVVLEGAGMVSDQQRIGSAG